MMYFVYYTRSKQEQMVSFGWLIRRGYTEQVSTLGTYLIHVQYDYVCIDIAAKEFGFFQGQFNNPQNVSFMTPRNIRLLLEEIQLAETNQLISFTYTTNVTPWEIWTNVPYPKLEYKFFWGNGL